MPSLQEIRAKLMSQQARAEGGGRDNSIYPFWNIPEGSTAILRFLPDNNSDNTFFWVERLIIRLPFSGVDGDSQKNVTVQVPCMEMYGKTCPILSEIRPWFKDPELDSVARTYWKKKSYIFQGFVVDDALGETEKPDNPVRRFVINSSIYNIIKQSLMDPEMEDLPVDYVNGRDFRLTKGKKGQYADYSTSKWSMKTRALSDDEAEAIETHGLFDLSSFLPKEPSEEELEVIKEMFQASVDGEPYDSNRWGQYYRPSGMGDNSGQQGTSSQTQAKKPVKNEKPVKVNKPAKEEEPEEVEESTEETSEEAPAKKTSASDALAKLKARTAKKSEESVKEAEDSDDADDQPETPSASAKSAKADPSEILAALRQRAKKS